VGTGIARITPPLDVGLLMSSVEQRWAPFKRVRLPLHARAVVVESSGRRVAVVSLELLGLSEKAMSGMDLFRKAIVRESRDAVELDSLVLTCTHSHSAPETMALSDLYQSSSFRSWVETLSGRIGQAIRMAADRLRPCSLSLASTTAPGLAIHRRIKTKRGVLLSHPEPPPEIVLSREGAIDDSVHVAAFQDQAGQIVCLLVNAACHPVHEMCCPAISPDYPGILSSALERKFNDAHVLFLNGADGNVNPPTVSTGPAAAESHGLRLAELVDSVLADARPVSDDGLELLWKPLELPLRSFVGQEPAIIRTHLAALRMADAVFCFIPGEPFAETGLAIRAGSPFPFTVISGYAEGSIGYIPTDEAYLEGGYETECGAWSPLAPGSETILRRSAIELLNRLHRVPSVGVRNQSKTARDGFSLEV
jgi:neutral ceramidase